MLLELEARLQRSLGDFELGGVGIGRGQTVLKLVSRPSQGARDRVLWVPHHPREQLGRGGDCAEGSADARQSADRLRCPRGEGTTGSGREQ
jgi:hypothetical protein